jgi:hypothetical protein
VSVLIMLTFALSEDSDDPCDPECWNYRSRPVDGQGSSLEEAAPAAAACMVHLADDPWSFVHSVT